jgi:hypothetical protein
MLAKLFAFSLALRSASFSALRRFLLGGFYCRSLGLVGFLLCLLGFLRGLVGFLLGFPLGPLLFLTRVIVFTLLQRLGLDLLPGGAVLLQTLRRERHGALLEDGMQDGPEDSVTPSSAIFFG